jgi:hypothetical protein
MTLWKYLTGLKRPRDWNSFVDLLSKTVVAAAGTAIAWGLAAHAGEQQRLEAQRADRRAVMDLFLTFMPTHLDDPQFDTKISTLTAYCNAEAAEQEDGALHEDTVLRLLCERVAEAGEEYRRRNEPAAAEAIEQAAQGDAAQYVHTAAAASQGVALAAAEAAEPPSAASGWHTVIASIPRTKVDAVPRLARALDDKLAAAGLGSDVQVYLTRLSDSYALTLGTLASKEEASRRAQRVRATGVVTDAFAQPDRDWKRVLMDTPRTERSPLEPPDPA